MITLLDNAGTPGASRAEVYQIDLVNRVATLTRSLES
jgi:hypothetical protein